MGDIKDLKNVKLEKTVEGLKKTYCEITGYDPKYEEALKEKDGFYRLAKKISKMEDDDEFVWYLNDGCADFGMGITKTRMFDCDLVITAEYGGGRESIIWVWDNTTVEDIYNWLKKNYEGSTFVRMG